MPRHSHRRAAAGRRLSTCSARNTAQASRHLPRTVALAALPPCGLRCRDWWPLGPRTHSLLAAPCTSPRRERARCRLRAAYVSRWSGIIAVAAQWALASSLLELLLDTVAAAAGEPAVHEVLQDERWLDAGGPRPPTCLVACRCTGTARVTVAKSVCGKKQQHLSPAVGGKVGNATAKIAKHSM